MLYQEAVAEPVLFHFPLLQQIHYSGTMIGGNLLWTGPLYQTPPINSTTTYYVAAGSFCPSSYVPVTATIFSLPVVSLGNDTIVVLLAFVIVNAGTGFASYLWSTTETTQSIIVQNSGAYSVTVTDANGCSATDTINILVTVGLTDADSKDVLHIHPNPVQSLLTLELNSTDAEGLQLIDVTGRVVWHSEITDQYLCQWHFVNLGRKRCLPFKMYKYA